MIHEILLSLSGHPSPLLEQAERSEDVSSLDFSFLISPPEQALLAPLAHLSQLHLQLKKHTQELYSSHPSIICRAVGSSIAAQQLRAFQQKILEVEESILSKDAGYVGGYDIVPLSTIVNEFTPWTRRLEWLLEVAQFMLSWSNQEKQKREPTCTGADIINFLRKELHTGYADLEEMCISLLKVAEMAWLKQLSSWVLYGRLPAFCSQDFFIQEEGPIKLEPGVLPEFSMHIELIPSFVTQAVAASILFIGKCLNQLRYQSTHGLALASSSNPVQVLALLPVHLDYLRALKSPISSFGMESAITSIRHSMAQNALSQLLPVQMVVEFLTLLQEFLLLGRGEFAVSLISNADRQIRSRDHAQESLKPVRKAGLVNAVVIKDGELAGLLKHTLSELTSLQNEKDSLDDVLDSARDFLRLATMRTDAKSGAATMPGTFEFPSLVFPVPTLLTISLPSSSPLNLLLTSADLNTYSVINAFLLSIRRAHLHLASIWKLTALRRCWPRPLGQSHSCTQAGERTVANRRKRDSLRALQLRTYWAIASKALFVISEMSSHFQVEVIGNSWEHFRNWLNEPDINGLLSAQSKLSGPDAASSHEVVKQLKTSELSVTDTPFRVSSSYKINEARSQADPATLSLAHSQYLHALTSALLVWEDGFLKTLVALLTTIDHFVALFFRLHSVQQGLHLEETGGMVDVLATHKADEIDILAELRRSRLSLDGLLSEIVQCLKEIEARRTVGSDELDSGMVNLGLGSGYVPWKGSTLERLVMKLEVSAGRKDVVGSLDESRNQ